MNTPSLDTSRPLRTAVIGYGLGGRVFHAPLVGADPAYALNAVVTGNPERAAEVSERYGAEAIATPDALFERAGEFDLVVVTSPNATHVPLAHRALDAGLDVVVDKPSAITVAEAREVSDHAGSVGRRVTVFQNRRWDGDFLTVRRLVAEGDAGALGAVRQFESAFEWWKPVLGGKAWKSEAVPAEGGGILYDLGPHLIDQALQLFGPVDVAGGGVHAELDRRREGSVADDDSFVTLHHRNGVRSRLWMNAVAPANRPRFRIVGSRAVLSTWGLDPQERQLIGGMTLTDAGFGLDETHPDALLQAPGENDSSVALERGAYSEFYRQLAVALRTGGPLPVDPRDSEQVLAIIAEAHRQNA